MFFAELSKSAEEVKERETSNEDETSSSEDDENAELLTEELEEGFFKILSRLKKKDPGLYEESARYFSAKNYEGKLQSDPKSKEKKKTKKKSIQECKEWLRGQKDKVEDEEVKKDLEALHDFWTSPNLNKDDQFLRDYILNKKFLEPDEDFDPEEEIKKLSEEEKEVEEQLLFEHKYNCRFENTEGQSKEDSSLKGEQETSVSKKIKNKKDNDTDLTKSSINNKNVEEVLKSEQQKKSKKKKRKSSERRQGTSTCIKNEVNDSSTPTEKKLITEKIVQIIKKDSSNDISKESNPNKNIFAETEQGSSMKIKKERCDFSVNEKDDIFVKTEEKQQITSPLSNKKRKSAENLEKKTDVKRVKHVTINKHNNEIIKQKHKKNTKIDISTLKGNAIKKEIKVENAADKQGSETKEIPRKSGMKVKKDKKESRYRNLKVLMNLVSSGAVDENKGKTVKPTQISDYIKIGGKIVQNKNFEHCHKNYVKKKILQFSCKKNKHYQGEIRRENKPFKMNKSKHKKKKAGGLC